VKKEHPSLPEQNYSEEVSLPKHVGHFFKTRLLAQFLVIVFVLVALYIPFHHYLPTYRDMWYGLRPSDKELTFENSDQMPFVDEKTGKFLIWYETRPDGYRFFDGPGFYGAGKEREQADTDAKIQMLKQWVDRNAAKKKQEQDQTIQLQQSQTTIQDLSAQIVQFKESQKTLEGEVASQEEQIVGLEKQNKSLTSQVEIQNKSAAPAPVPEAIAASSTSEPSVAVVDNPDFYKHGAIIPPNPKPLAWFQSLQWGKYPGKPYVMNYHTGFFEIPYKPETRIAPHPHYIATSTKTGQLERPYTIFVKINGEVPKEVQIPPLDSDYYQKTQVRYGATFNSMYPYEVTAGGVTY
jgi:hypothetical protein